MGAGVEGTFRTGILRTGAEGCGVVFVGVVGTAGLGDDVCVVEGVLGLCVGLGGLDAVGTSTPFSITEDVVGRTGCFAAVCA